jgi:hypothetical protein
MANNQVVTAYDDAGYPASASKTSPVTLGALQVVKGTPGRLLRVSVTTATASAAVTIYDNASAASGTPLLTIPSGTAAGTLYDLNLPAANGITVQSAGATGNITVGYA